MITITKNKGQEGLIQSVTSYATPSDPKMLGNIRKRARREREADYEQTKKALLTVIHENSNIQPSE